MFEVHLICKRSGVGLLGLSFNKNTKKFSSGRWQLRHEDALKLVGGKIYLHPTKSSGSTVGGTVEAVIGPDSDGRFVFVFASELECKDAPWRGMGHGMAWTGGVIEI